MILSRSEASAQHIVGSSSLARTKTHRWCAPFNPNALVDIAKRIYGAYRHTVAVLPPGRIWSVSEKKRPHTNTQKHAQKHLNLCRCARYCVEFMFPVCRGQLFRTRCGVGIFIARSHDDDDTAGSSSELQTRPISITHWIEDCQDHAFIYRSHSIAKQLCDFVVAGVIAYSVAIYSMKSMNEHATNCRFC